MRVLLIEDETALADVLARNLRARGFAVDVEAAAEDAIDQLNRVWPDVVVLDINLPDYSGWEVLRRLTEDQRRSLRVVVISAAPISPKRIAEFRPAHWFQKPFPMDSLVRAVRGDVAIVEDVAGDD